MADVLVISGHPDYKNSVANRAILDELHELLPSAEIVYLDALYPDFRINVEVEQKRLLEANTLVMEFPIWWYGAPSLIHKYIEDVFAHGFAYGSRGKALHGKKYILSFTAGAPEEAYSVFGGQAFPMSDFMPPFLAMAKLTGLNYSGSIISYGMMHVGPVNKDGEIMAKARLHARRLAEMINS